MNRSLLAMCLLNSLLLVSGCSLLFMEAVVGSGVATTEQRQVDTFREIGASGALDVTIEWGEQCQVTVDGDDNLVPLVITEVKDGELEVRTPSNTNLRPNIPLRVMVQCPALTSLDVSGASDVRVASLEADRFELEVSGASEVSVTGSCNQLDVDVSGASDVDLAALTAVNAEFDLSGASRLDLRATDSIEGEASGASTVRHAGTSNVNVRSSGVSSVKELEQ